MTVFGAQHGGDLLQVGGIALLLRVAGEGDRDDSLCDVDQVQLIALLQGLQQTHAPVRQAEELFKVRNSTHRQTSAVQICCENKEKCAQHVLVVEHLKTSG